VELDVSSRELPEVVAAPEAEEGGPGKLTLEELKARQSRSVQAWLDKQVGAEKLHLAKLLQQHGVIVRGGQEQGQKLMEALLAWKQGGGDDNR